MSDLDEFYKKIKKGKESENFSIRNDRIDDSAKCDEAPHDPESGNFENGGSLEYSCKRWASDDIRFWACKTTYDILPSGLYKPMYNTAIGYYLEKQIIDTDELIILPDTSSEEVLEEIKTFWTLKEKFKEGGFVHKRGILLWGDPGSGKTSTIQLLLKSIIEDYNGIAVFAGNPNITSNCLQMIRRIEPVRPMIVVFEDFETMIQQWGEAEYLALLDGESQVSNVVFIATTNYPERLDKRFVDRPSRFDTIKLIPMPGADARRVYLQTKEPTLKGEELEKWVKECKGFSVAHLKEMIISVRYYGNEFKEVFKRLKLMNKRRLTSDDAVNSEPKIGFLGHTYASDEDDAA